jgi:hypothetical protein
MGGPVKRTERLDRRIGGLLLYGLGQRRVLGQAYPGLMHGLIFYGFVAFFIGTSLVGVEMDAGHIVGGYPDEREIASIVKETCNELARSDKRMKISPNMPRGEKAVKKWTSP